MLLSEDFVAIARMMARSKGVDLKYVVFPRRIENLAPGDIEAETGKACEEIVRLLGRPSGKEAAVS